MAYFQLKNDSQEKSLEDVSALLNQNAASLEQIIDSAKASVQLISQNQQVLNYLYIEDEDERYNIYQRPLQKAFSSIQAVLPDYIELRILLPDGFEDLRVVIPYTENEFEEEGHTNYFKLLQNASTDIHASLDINEDTEDLVLYVSKRMTLVNPATDSFNTKPTLRGYLVITVALNDWLAQIEESSWGSGGGLVLTGSSGEPLAAANVLAPMAEELESHFTDERTQQVETAHLHKLRLLTTDYYHDYLDLDYGLLLHAILPEYELIAAGRRIVFLVGAVLFVVLVISLPLLVALLKQQIINPIQQLRTALLDIGEGDRQVSLPAKNKDEFADLNNAFNKMSTNLYESNERITRLAYKDVLTGLPNRLTFRGMVEREISLARRNNAIFALLFLDLDNFKNVNDTLGHEYGDQLLKDVGKRLSLYLRDYDCIGTASELTGESALARLGGDEFTVLLSQLHSPMQAGIVGQRIIDLLAQPLQLNGQSYYVGASIGIAMYPADGGNVEELIKHADLAMYEAKKQGRNNYQYFFESISQQSRNRAQLEQKIHKAIENVDFQLFYQPIIASGSGGVVYYEALIRWWDADLGYIPPDQFIPLAEENGTVNAIGDWVIEEAVRQLAEWRSGDLPDAAISINVSGVQLSNPDFARHFTRALHARHIAPESLIIELTETAVIDGKQDVINTLTSLRSAGTRIALDDFGTGFSSLSHLINLPIDILKIDKSFVSRCQDRESAAILSAIIKMAHVMNLGVVAEGVEDQNQKEFLIAQDCDYMQGYFFCRPQAAGEFTAGHAGEDIALA